MRATPMKMCRFRDALSGMVGLDGFGAREPRAIAPKLLKMVQKSCKVRDVTPKQIEWIRKLAADATHDGAAYFLFALASQLEKCSDSEVRLEMVRMAYTKFMREICHVERQAHSE